MSPSRRMYVTRKRLVSVGGTTFSTSSAVRMVAVARVRLHSAFRVWGLLVGVHLSGHTPMLPGGALGDILNLHVGREALELCSKSTSMLSRACVARRGYHRCV